MATSLPQVVIPLNTWIDIYAETGITAGTQIIIQNTGSGEVKLSESAAAPSLTTGHNKLVTRGFFTNDTGNVGAWAFAKTGTVLQVEEA